MPMPNWMTAWAWQMAFWMTGAAILWIALIVATTWLIARWETRTLRRVNGSSLQMQRAHDAISTGAYEEFRPRRTTDMEV